MSDKRVQLSVEEALAMLPDGDEIHTFVQAGPVMIGADWPRAEIEELIRVGVDKNACELAGPISTSAGHGMVVWDGNDLLFVETRKTQAPEQEEVRTPWPKSMI